MLYYIFSVLFTLYLKLITHSFSDEISDASNVILHIQCVISQSIFLPRYATFSPFFASFVTLSPRCNLSPNIIDNYATLCNIICQLNYRRKNGCSRRQGGENAAIYRRGLHNVA